MEAGLSDHVWDVAELVERAMAEPAPVVAPSPVPPPPGGDELGEQLELFATEPTPVPTRPALRLIKGGKASAANEGDVKDHEEEAPDTVRGTSWGLLEAASKGVG